MCLVNTKKKKNERKMNIKKSAKKYNNQQVYLPHNKKIMSIISIEADEVINTILLH